MGRGQPQVSIYPTLASLRRQGPHEVGFQGLWEVSSYATTEADAGNATMDLSWAFHAKAQTPGSGT